MNPVSVAKTELAAAIARGVRQCVCMGSERRLYERPEGELSLFAVDQERDLALALDTSEFDKLKSALFVWLGTSYRTADAVLSSLRFIASLPQGSGVVLDYVVESAAFTHTALDGLASRIMDVGGRVKHLVQPQAVAAMLRGMGFQKVVDLEFGVNEHLVIATV